MNSTTSDCYSLHVCHLSCSAHFFSLTSLQAEPRDHQKKCRARKIRRAQSVRPGACTISAAYLQNTCNSGKGATGCLCAWLVTRGSVEAWQGETGLARHSRAGFLQLSSSSSSGSSRWYFRPIVKFENIRDPPGPCRMDGKKKRGPKKASHHMSSRERKMRSRQR
ncbi:uncharacterized protein K489DRAFT_95830 [Dissoconium aciculare CBS 342.82]|uniref:Uncharacterized protein n=1 Tax=Dissoconium aciculare CBS 342.82 TaxID=1314786 RepID=A0A6J3LRS2_9PEZI|nr:uncharacterized protein K489DRAFT_95830 [Dissoconium aciculare CBS 342.82]KAF1818323.1 hypothetical protein K489DRAFT_95830 [Dissoconium aciculare CBS 342.82]